MYATERIIAAIIRREGDYVNHMADRGGPTKFGITLGTLAAWRGAEVSPSDVRALTEAEAREILRELYVLKPGFHRIEDPRLREQVIDAGVLHGPGWAARRLQEVAGVAADGIIGPVTLRAVNPRVEPEDSIGLSGRFAARRVRKLARITANDPSQIVFLVGWIHRATEFLMR